VPCSQDRASCGTVLSLEISPGLLRLSISTSNITTSNRTPATSSQMRHEKKERPKHYRYRPIRSDDALKRSQKPPKDLVALVFPLLMQVYRYLRYLSVTQKGLKPLVFKSGQIIPQTFHIGWTVSSPVLFWE
jgi:hypothetical protein